MPTVMPIKRLPTNLTEPRQCTRTQSWQTTLVWNNRRLPCQSVMRETRIFKKCCNFKAFFGFLIFGNWHLSKDKWLLSSAVMPGKCTVDYQTKWVSGWTHTGEKQGTYSINMYSVAADWTGLSATAPTLHLLGSLYCQTVRVYVQRRGL